MYDKKKGLFRLIETYINDYHKDAIEEYYGIGTKIRIHSVSHSLTSNTLLFEAVIMLGEIINESVLDRKLADILIQEALIYFYPDQHIKVYIRWDA